MARRKRIVCVCGMGLGTGLIIKQAVTKALKALGFDEMAIDLEVGDVATAKGAGTDLIITNAEFGERLKGGGIEVCIVENLMDTEAIKDQVENYVRDWPRSL